MDAIDEVLQDVRRNYIPIIFSADINAKLGDGSTSEAYSAIGQHGYGEQNSRG